MSATAWATMKTEFPNIKVMIFPEAVLQAMKKANDEVLGDMPPRMLSSKKSLIHSRPL